jgi:hypothetical protein
MVSKQHGRLCDMCVNQFDGHRLLNFKDGIPLHTNYVYLEHAADRGI